MLTQKLQGDCIEQLVDMQTFDGFHEEHLFLLTQCLPRQQQFHQVGPHTLAKGDRRRLQVVRCTRPVVKGEKVVEEANLALQVDFRFVTITAYLSYLIN